MTIKNVTVLGTGVLGAQIAFQTAFSGFNVTAYDIDDAALAKAEKFIAYLESRYRGDVATANDASIAAARSRLKFTTDLAAAVAEADLVIEAVPERIEIKREVYGKLAKVAKADTIFVSNSSTLLPSAMADATGRPEKFLALHFANEIWKHNVAEVMGHPGTSPAIYNQIVDFARQIGMVPIQIQKEQPGYVLNSLLVPFLLAAGDLLVKDIASPEDIDATWKIATGSPLGPVQILDIVGLTTAYNIAATVYGADAPFPKLLKENYIDKGKLGVSTGEGFYKHANS